MRVHYLLPTEADHLLHDFSMIRVIRFDLERGSADYVLERAIPAVFLFRLMIRNDLVVVHLPHSFQIILMNWREGKCVILDFNDGTVSFLTIAH